MNHSGVWYCNKTTSGNSHPTRQVFILSDLYEIGIEAADAFKGIRPIEHVQGGQVIDGTAEARNHTLNGATRTDKTADNNSERKKMRSLVSGRPVATTDSFDARAFRLRKEVHKPLRRRFAIGVQERNIVGLRRLPSAVAIKSQGTRMAL